MKCGYCNIEVLIPFQCNFCGKYLCEAHRLPENHDCSKAPARVPLGSYQTKELIRFRQAAKRSKNMKTLVEHIPVEGRKVTVVDDGKFHFIKFDVMVPEEVFAEKKYQKRIKKAKTVKELERILFDSYEGKNRK